MKRNIISFSEDMYNRWYASIADKINWMEDFNHCFSNVYSRKHYGIKVVYQGGFLARYIRIFDEKKYAEFLLRY